MRLPKVIILIVSLCITLYGWNLVLNDSSAEAGTSDGKVVIISPKEGSGSSGGVVELTFEIDKGKSGDHIHLYVDGKFDVIVRENSHKLKGLAKGKHKIEAKLASKGHAELGPNGIVEVTVK